MAEPHVITGLLAKRRPLAREVDAAERYLNRLQADLAHIDAVLRHYTDPHGGMEPGAILYGLVPRRTRWFRSGELPRCVLTALRCVLTALREAGPAGLTAAEIAARIMAAKGMDPDDAECRALVSRGVIGCLRRRGRGGLIEAVPGQDGGAVRWRVAG